MGALDELAPHAATGMQDVLRRSVTRLSGSRRILTTELASSGGDRGRRGEGQRLVLSSPKQRPKSAEVRRVMTGGMPCVIQGAKATAAAVTKQEGAWVLASRRRRQREGSSRV